MNTRIRLTAFLVIVALAGSLWAQEDIQSIKTYLDAAKSYDFDQSRDTLDKLEQTIRAVTSNQASAGAEVESLLLGSLTEGASSGLTDFICRQLSVVGSVRSVPVLLPLLQTSATAEPARYALERIPGSSVDEALRKSLSSTEGQTRLGIITTLGARRHEDSVSVLAPLVKDSDTVTACATVTALGRIGNAEATEVLLQVHDQVSGDVQQRVLDALLQCAEERSSSNPEQAADIYRTLFDQKYNTVIRAAALRGLARTEPLKLVYIILPVLQSMDESLKPTALALVRQIPESAQILQVADLMPTLSPAHQVLLLVSLAEGHKTTALPYIKTAARSQNPDVQTAALSALGVLGNASCVELLASAAAVGDPRAEEAARDSLNRVSGEGVDSEMIRLIRESNNTEARVKLIEAVGDRRTASAAQTLMDAVDSDNRRINQAALQSLALVGRPEDIPLLIRRLATSTRMQTDLEDAIVGIAEQRNIKADVTGQVLTLASNSASTDIQRSKLRILSRLGGDKGLPFVEQCLNSTNDAVSTEAARALSRWPTRTAMALARRIAETGDSPIHRILALRGFIYMAALPTDESPQQVFNTLQQAMNLATRDDERWLVLSAMTQAPCRESLTFVQSQLTNEALAAEAQSALMEICQSLAESEPDLVRDALNQVLAGNPNRLVRREARSILRRL